MKIQQTVTFPTNMHPIARRSYLAYQASVKQSVSEQLAGELAARRVAITPPPPPPAAAARKPALSLSDRLNILQRALHSELKQNRPVLQRVATRVSHEPLVATRRSQRSTTPAAKKAFKVKTLAPSEPLRHVETVVKRHVVVGVREAASRLCLRSIRRGEFTLKPAQTKEKTSVVVGVREAATRLALRSIRRGEFTLKPAQTKETTGVVVGVREAATRLALRSIRRGEFTLKPTQTKETTRVVVGVRDAARRLCLRAIRRREYALKHARTHETHEIVVGKSSKSSKPAPKQTKLGALKQHKSLLADRDTLQTLAQFAQLDQKAQAFIMTLL